MIFKKTCWIFKERCSKQYPHKEKQVSSLASALSKCNTYLRKNKNWPSQCPTALCKAVARLESASISCTLPFCCPFPCKPCMCHGCRLLLEFACVQSKDMIQLTRTVFANRDIAVKTNPLLTPLVKCFTPYCRRAPSRILRTDPACWANWWAATIALPPFIRWYMWCSTVLSHCVQICWIWQEHKQGWAKIATDRKFV